ncbi:MAG: glycosyltransferase family 4 protein [Candidatus Thermoplasmatota archaeon]|nr:glycosyltransferase family 4 protein [Candidatus Thermoplasmatota archaeon]
MKIVILVRILWTAGAQKTAIEEARTLQNFGHDVKLIFLRETESGKKLYPLMTNIDWEITGSDSSSFLTPLYDQITGLFMPDRKGDGRVDYDLIRKFPNHITSFQPDIIICHDSWAGLAGFYAKRKLSYKYSVIVHEKVGKFNVPLMGNLANHFEKTVLSNANRVFAINDKIADSIKQQYGVEPVVNFHGMDMKYRESFMTKENLIFANSTWDSDRASDVYLQIVERMPSYKMEMVGRWRDAKLKSSYQEKIRKRNLESRFLLRENLDEDEMINIYKRAKYFIRFGFQEWGNPHGVVDAVSYSVPPVINSDLGISSIIKNYKAGIVLDNIKPENVADSIDKINNPLDYSNIQNNLNALSKKYSWYEHCKLLIENSN